MSRRTVLIILVAVACLAAAIPALAAPLRQDEVRLEIISPASGSQVRGTVPIIGSAVVPNFQFYKVEWGIGPNPGQWAVIGGLHDRQVTNNQLEVWNTAGVPDDIYTLRLTGVKNDGNWEEFYVRNLQVSNSAPAATATPSATTTPEGTVTATPTPGEATPQATSEATTEAETQETTEAPSASTPGVQIIAPTAALMQPSPTALPADDQGGSLLPFDTESLKDAFVFGAMAMGAVFAVVGIVFGIRRLF
jgi:hypothetical protein